MGDAMDETADWQELNAYIDGELPAERASAVAEAIASDRHLARQAALLSRMKASVASSLELPEGLHRLPPTPPRRRTATRAALAAAALAGLLVGGAALWLQPAGPDWRWAGLAPAPGGPAEAQGPAWLERAVALHRAPTAEPPSGILAASRFPGFLPDLTSTRLTLDSIRPAEIPGLGRGAVARYSGSRGCRVSLFALEAADGGLPESLQRSVSGALASFRWRVGAVDYLLLAEGMDAVRLGMIADTVYEASRRFRPLDRSARERLADARRSSAPCRA
jgi:anti-sigma factor RsiW